MGKRPLVSGPTLVLAGVSALTLGAVLYVHYDQKWQKEVSSIMR